MIPEERKASKAAARKKYRLANPDYQRNWRQKNIEKCRLRSKLSARRWREKHPDHAKTYYREHAEEIARKARIAKDKEPDKFRTRSRSYLQRHPEYYLLRSARSRAAKAGLPCTITAEWIKSRLEAGRCEVTGIPFARARAMHCPWSPSLDRIVGKLGYTPENVRLVIWAYNAAKGGWTDEDTLTVALAVVDAADAKRAIA